jgi:lipoate-protein ligase A
MSKIAEKTRGNLRSPNCFASPAQFEIESGDEGKLIGSAQVIKDGVMLQHGAIPLTDSYTKISKYFKKDGTPLKSISSLSQVSGLRVGEEQLLEALKMGFGKYLYLEDGKLNDFETRKYIELSRDKYSTKEWIFRK